MPVQPGHSSAVKVLRLAMLALLIAPPVLAAPLRATPAQAIATRPNATRFCLKTATHIAICNYADPKICARDAGLVDGTCTAGMATLAASGPTAP